MKKSNVYMAMAGEMACLSHCQSFQVACLLVKDGRIISTGVNGTPKGFRNCGDKFPQGVSPENREEHSFWSNVHEIHAEQNAILMAAKHGVLVDGCVAYSTLKPCAQCTKLLIGVGVKKIFYDEDYDRMTAEETKVIAEFLFSNNVEIEKIVWPVEDVFTNNVISVQENE